VDGVNRVVGESVGGALECETVWIVLNASGLVRGVEDGMAPFATVVGASDCSKRRMASLDSPRLSRISTI
jgi:hypothetical protein